VISTFRHPRKVWEESRIRLGQVGMPATRQAWVSVQTAITPGPDQVNGIIIAAP
jgi:hypothetical protein